MKAFDAPRGLRGVGARQGCVIWGRRGCSISSRGCRRQPQGCWGRAALFPSPHPERCPSTVYPSGEVDSGFVTPACIPLGSFWTPSPPHAKRSGCWVLSFPIVLRDTVSYPKQQRLTPVKERSEIILLGKTEFMESLGQHHLVLRASLFNSTH